MACKRSQLFYPDDKNPKILSCPALHRNELLCLVTCNTHIYQYVLTYRYWFTSNWSVVFVFVRFCDQTRTGMIYIAFIVLVRSLRCTVFLSQDKVDRAYESNHWYLVPGPSTRYQVPGTWNYTNRFGHRFSWSIYDSISAFHILVISNSRQGGIRRNLVIIPLMGWYHVIHTGTTVSTLDPIRTNPEIETMKTVLAPLPIFSFPNPYKPLPY